MREGERGESVQYRPREGSSMRDDLIDLLKKILKTNAGPDFLPALEQKDLETLIAIIRDRIDQEKIVSMSADSYFSPVHYIFW
jgi:hypothetical protein